MFHVYYIAPYLCRRYFTSWRGVRAFDTRATESSLSCRQNTSSPPGDNTRVSFRGSEARTQRRSFIGKKAFSRIGLSRCKKALSHRSRRRTAVTNDNAIFSRKCANRGESFSFFLRLATWILIHFAIFSMYRRCTDLYLQCLQYVKNFIVIFSISFFGKIYNL